MRRRLALSLLVLAQSVDALASVQLLHAHMSRHASIPLRVPHAPVSTESAAEEERLPRSVLPISLSVFAQMIGEGIAISSLPLHMRALGASPVQIGMATSAFSIAQLVCCPLLVSASSRMGRTAILRVCLAGASLSQLLIVLSSSASGIIFGRFLGGVFAASVPVAQAGVTDLVKPSQSALALSRVSAASQSGVVVGPAFSAIGAAALASLGVPSRDGWRVRGVFASSAAFALAVLAFTGRSTHAAATSPSASPTATMDTAGQNQPPKVSELPATGLKEQRRRPSIDQGGRRLSGRLPYSAQATKATKQMPLASQIRTGGALAQMALRLMALVIGWSLTLCVSTYCLFGSAFLGFAQPQLSTTFSTAAALVIATQLVLFPRLVTRLGEHLSCALGLTLLSGGMGGMSLLKVQPLHSALYFVARVGAAIGDTATATLVARLSEDSEARARNLGLIQSTRAGARIVTPILSAWLFERSRLGTVAPGALPYLIVASLSFSLLPVPLGLKSFEKDGAAQR